MSFFFAHFLEKGIVLSELATERKMNYVNLTVNDFFFILNINK